MILHVHRDKIRLYTPGDKPSLHVESKKENRGNSCVLLNKPSGYDFPGWNKGFILINSYDVIN